MAKQAKVTDLANQLQEQVSNHSIYVWGGSGNLCKSVSESWIREKESSCNHGEHADDAVAAWKTVMASPYAGVARCFDCSGYVSYCLMQIGALDKRRDCDGLYDRCTPTTELKNGTLLFRVNSSNQNDETHVGVYFNGYQYHSKGRKQGVVKEKFNKKYWHKFGWFKNLVDDQQSPTPEQTPTQPTPTTTTDAYVMVLGSVRVRKSAPLGACFMIAHKGDMLPYLGETVTLNDGAEWYFVSTENGNGYISAFTNRKKKYTKLIGA